MKNKIIISNKCREHMETHKKEFLYDWEELLESAHAKDKFNELKEQFEICKIDFGCKNIGYKNLVATDNSDKIVFAKRLGRDIYTRFVKNRENEITNTVLVFLNRNKRNPKEYYLITMFPGTESEKEPEDKNIESKEELDRCLDFWSENALVFNGEMIQENSLLNYCPYI